MRIVDLDALTYAAHPAVWARQSESEGVVTVEGSIADAALVRSLLERWNIDGIIHFAAESHVDNSVSDPMRFVRTNVEGTAVLLTEALRFWERKGWMEKARFHHVSTDEVFGSLGAAGFFSETRPYAPSNPYSASKASSDLLAKAYAHTYGLGVTVSNCTNNYGPWQHAEKLIPTVMRSCLSGKRIPIYGTGRNIRDWIWVGDHCRAVEEIFFRAKAGSSYCIGARNERTNLEITTAVCRLLDELRPAADGAPYEKLIRFVPDRPGHDLRYAIDPSKIERDLGWRAQTAFGEGLRRTVEWYLSDGSALLKAAA